MKRVSASDALRLRQLEQRLGSRLVRTVLTDSNRRIMRPDRLERLSAGRGKLSDNERERLERLSINAQSVEKLSKKEGQGNGHNRLSKVTKKNRSIRDWLVHGKERGAPRPDDLPGKTDEQKAIHGLRYLGVDPSEKHYYLRKVRA